ncbi:hypothetical protein BMF94_2076 [Rhodotorula taiwanensis]|uniref:dolichyl-phosphate beta-glucosyltransferase n=1 Tax=Rhodotorula taiwanensis TaxID=741276 RepID=A0A2S5BDH5_9BASI|nr:hypothetical protein BMF94_2076 [Rhodotorula taiwanensis]
MSGLAAAVAALLGILIVLYTLLVHFSPRDPIEHDSEATYCTAADPENPLPLARLFHPDADTASKDRPSVKLSVVVPAYNESKRIEVMLRPAVEFLETRPVDTEADGSYELLIVDDGSTDGTSEKALKIAKQLEGEFGAKRGQIKVCRLIRNRGKGGATKHGVLHSSGERILFVDADGATRFEDLALLEEELAAVISAQSDQRAAHGLVVGSRAHLVSTEAVVKRSALRNLLMRGFHLYLSLLGLSSIRDTQCGFKLQTRSTAQLLYPSLHSPGWIFDCELLLLAERSGVPLREVGVRWKEVPGSKLDVIKDSIRMARDLLVIRANYLVGRWAVPSRVETGIPVGGDGIKVNGAEAKKKR